MTSRPTSFSPRARLARYAVLAACSIAGVAGCSASGDEISAMTTSAPTETTVAVAETTTTSTTSTTTTMPPVTAPLTGLEVDNELAVLPPVVAVKIDNHPSARPQWGLDAADVVFEIQVEGISRFMALFHSQAAEVVGPVRSGRTSDLDLISMLNRPIFAYSGANAGTVNLISQRDHIDARHGTNGSLYRRIGGRRAPHNLVTSTADLFTRADGEIHPPPQLFAYRSDVGDDADPVVGEAADADAVVDEAADADADAVVGEVSDRAVGEVSGGVTVRFDNGHRVDFTWSEERQGWLRFQARKPHGVPDGEQYAPANVVVLEVGYRSGQADSQSPEAITVGDGKASVFTDGRLVEGTWSRPTAQDVFTLQDADGNEIALTPGQTWVELPHIGDLTPMNELEGVLAAVSFSS